MANDKDNDARIRSRRKFLIGGGSALAALAAGGTAWQLLKSPPVELQEMYSFPAGDMTHDIQQSEINQIYRDIFNKIKTAVASHKPGKPLAIMIAEDHTGTHSLISQLMVLSVAQRFGITTLAVEDTPGDVEKFKQKTKPLLESHSAAFNALQNGINPENDPQKTPIAQAIARTYCNITGTLNLQGAKDGQLWVPSYASRNALLRGFRLVPVDPKKAEIDSTVREPGMIRELGNMKHNYVLTMGFAHIPVLAKAMKEQGQDVVVIDVINKNLDRNRCPKENLERFDQLASMTDLKIVMNGKPPVQLNTLFAHADEAEFESLYAQSPDILALAKQVMRRELQLDAQPQRGR